MSLKSPNLDNRGFQDFVDDAKRLIPTYLPQWTNHNVSDPGVALIELFAWMSEQVIFRLNQVPDKLYTEFLNLLDVRPFPAKAATAELTFWLSAPTSQIVTVHKGTVVSGVDTTQIPGRIVSFATVEDLIIKQPNLTAALTGHGETGLTNVSDALRYDRERVKVFAGAASTAPAAVIPDPEPSPPRKPEAGDCFYLGFAETLAGQVLRLEVTAATQGHGIRPDRPPIVWQIWSGEYWTDCTFEDDTTGGLNRNGTITLYLPNKHQDLELKEIRAFWLRARCRQLTDEPAYEQSPEVLRLVVSTVGGTVVAEDSVTVSDEVLGRSLERPGQKFKLRNQSILPRRKHGETVRVRSAHGERVVVEEWVEVQDFSMSGPHDRHFMWDDSEGVIAFGPSVRYPDGTMVQHGAVPPLGAQIEVTAYRYGGGESGNIPAGAITNLYSTINYIARVVNRKEATGGIDAETQDNVKDRGPMTVRTGQRAVTTTDYQRLTEQDSRVARARCLRPTETGGPVTVLVVPKVLDKSPGELVIDDFLLPDSLWHDIAGYLDDRRVLGTRIELTTPYYVGVSAAALVRATPGKQAKAVESAALAALDAYLSPLRGGGRDRTGWPWDQPITTAALQAELMALPEILAVEQVVLFPVDLRHGRRRGDAVESISLDDRSLFLGFKHQVVVK